MVTEQERRCAWVPGSIVALMKEGRGRQMHCYRRQALITCSVRRFRRHRHPSPSADVIILSSISSVLSISPSFLPFYPCYLLSVTTFCLWPFLLSLFDLEVSNFDCKRKKNCILFDRPLIRPIFILERYNTALLHCNENIFGNKFVKEVYHKKSCKILQN